MDASTYPPPHEQIRALSLQGSPLMLRLMTESRGQHGRIWLRIHESGEIERADGDARVDVVVTPVKQRRLDERYMKDAVTLRDYLRTELVPSDLTGRGYGNDYPVQVFAGPLPVVEGFVGVEVEMGMMTDVFGVKGGTGPGRKVARMLDKLLP